MGKILLSDKENMKDEDVNCCGDEMGFKCSLKEEVGECSVCLCLVASFSVGRLPNVLLSRGLNLNQKSNPFKIWPSLLIQTSHVRKFFISFSIKEKAGKLIGSSLPAFSWVPFIFHC